MVTCRSYRQSHPTHQEDVVTRTVELSESQLAFRSAMANLSAAVNVVTTDGPAGRAGVAVCARVRSRTPRRPYCCASTASRSHDVVLANGRVCINVLGATQEDLAMHFAGAGGTSVPSASSTAGGTSQLTECQCWRTH